MVELLKEELLPFIAKMLRTVFPCIGVCPDLYFSYRSIMYRGGRDWGFPGAELLSSDFTPKNFRTVSWISSSFLWLFLWADIPHNNKHIIVNFNPIFIQVAISTGINFLIITCFDVENSKEGSCFFVKHLGTHSRKIWELLRNLV